MVTPHPTLTVYKASAGSGKTFTLAKEYISLLVENPLSYRNILAVTFTNKATEEMKMRILSQLYGIWKQLPESSDYLDAVREKTGLPDNVISQRAGTSLNNLLNNYNYFRVETIDTFFQSVMRNMARELDLTTNLRIGLNDLQVEELAVDQLIADLNTDDVVLQWIIRYIMENISDDKSWNVIGQIKKFGRTIFRDEYKETSEALNQKISEPGFFERYTKNLREIRQTAKERMTQWADQFFDILEGEGLTINDFSYGKTGVCSLFLKLQKGQFDESIVGKRATDCLGNPSKWYKNSHPRRELLHMLAESTLDRLLRQVIEERPRQWLLYKSADLTLRHLNQLRLLGCIEQKVHQLNEASNRFLLSDTQQLLNSLIDGSDSPFIFEKIGAQLEHVMIDEFQDTSTVQWQNFRVLLNESMSHANGSNLIVGDVKQSIYRWRSGDWRLLNDIERQFLPQELVSLNLDTNYRSMQRIITFNNTFFIHAAQLSYQALNEIHESEAAQLAKAYADVEQKIPSKLTDEGYVCIELLPSADYQQQVLSRLTDKIRELLEAGIRQNDIAILVRANAAIPVIAQHFMQQMPEVTIVSDEAFRLDASNAVRLLVHALRLLSNPEDQLSKAALAKGWLFDVTQTYHDDNELLLATTDLDALLPEAFTAHQEELRALPLYDLVERLYAIFGLESLKGQSAYICAFYDQLVSYVNECAADISSFLEEWDSNLCSKTIQSDETSGIRIYSIHKSKGLEYDHVLVPFCDWQLEKQTGNILWCQPKSAPFNDLPIAPIDYNQKQMMGTIYEHDYLDEHLQTTVDNLNLLYVAFTRARCSLYVIGRRKSPASRSMLIEQSLPLVVKDLKGTSIEGIEDEQQPIRFTYGSLPLPKEEKTEAATACKSSPNPFLQESSPLLVDIQTFERKVDFQQSNRSRDFTEGDDEENVRRQRYIHTGSILHEVFSTIRTTADIAGALHRLQSEGVIYDADLTPERITGMLRKRLSDPRVAEWFSDRWTLFNECTILSLDEDGRLIERRPDRVMTDGQEWVIVDFKFGISHPEYAAQVREYMKLIASMNHQPVRGYLWYVYANKIEEVYE